MTSVTVVDGDTTVVTVTTAGPQGATGTVAAAASGTATDPGITFISDPNTGIYNPSADNLSFSTGGVQRLSIASDGTINVVGNLTEGGNNVVSVGDTGTVTSAMILDGTIVNGDINASAAIADTKLATIATAGKVSNSATTATNANTASAIVARDASGNFSAGTITAALTGNASTVTTNANLTGDVTSVGNATSIAAGVIVNADVNASAAIAGTKISPDFGSQTITTTGVVSAALGAAATPSLTFTGDPNTGIYSPGADQVALATNGVQRLSISDTGVISTGINGAGSLVNGTALTLERYTGSDLHSRWVTANVSSGLQLGQTVGPASGGDSVARARVTLSAASGTYQKGFQWFDDSGNTVLGYVPSSGRIYLGDSINNGILSSYLASGTNIAGGTLTIAGGQGTGTGAGGPIIFSTAAAGSSGSSVNALTERARISSSGNVGIGTSAPAASLHVSGAITETPTGSGFLAGIQAGYAQAKLYGTNGSILDFGVSGASPSARILFDNSSSTLQFFTGGPGSLTERMRITSAGVLQIADAGNITVGTTTGTKIGTATTQKIGFYNATPVVQPAAVADATDAASGIARLIDLLARLRTLGIIAT